MPKINLLDIDELTKEENKKRPLKKHKKDKSVKKMKERYER